ncbi:MAG: zinc-ribbon domain-containing protein, partial [Acidobacteriota bacterium]
MTSNNTGEITCSVCGASNAKDWLYCQQCGSPLIKPELPPVAYAAPPSSRPEPPVDIPPTVVAQPVTLPVPPTVVAQPVV